MPDIDSKIAAQEVPPPEGSVRHGIPASPALKALVTVELGKILASPAFRTSRRSQDLLRHLVEKALAGDLESIKERMIGVQLFGRSANYDTAQDAIVRVAANDVRKRLADYYEHHDDPEHQGQARVSLTPGSYVPVFQIRDLEPPKPETKESEPSPVSSELEPQLRPREWRPWVRYGAPAFLFGCVVALAATYALMPPQAKTSTEPTPSAWTPAMKEFWKPLIADRAPVLIAFETRLFLTAGNLVVRDFDVNDSSAIDSSPSLMAIKRQFQISQLQETTNYTEAGGAYGIFQLAKLLGANTSELTVKRFSDVSADDLRRNHLLFLGKSNVDPSIRALLSHSAITDLGGKFRTVNPQTGKVEEYADHADKSAPTRWGEKYGMISILPGAEHGKRVLALTAGGSEQLQAVAEYVTSPAHVEELLRHVRRPDGAIPESYQVLMKAQFRSQVPVRLEYVTHRSLDP